MKQNNSNFLNKYKGYRYPTLNSNAKSKTGTKIYVIGCAVLDVDMKHSAQELGIDIEYKFLDAGLHKNPTLLTQKLQKVIDEVSSIQNVDRIIIGYGVCGKGTVDIHSHDIPLVIPKAHDCIAMFLGGDQEYNAQLSNHPGTCYLPAGWCNENFDFIFRQKNNKRVAFIDTGARQSSKYEAYAKKMAEKFNLEYLKISGNRHLIKKILTARKTDPDILFVPPLHVVEFDDASSTLSTNPVWEKKLNEISLQVSKPEPIVKIGLGIDAGGTYTDAVIYNINDKRTIDKSKSLTTKWDFTVGIGNALKKLNQEQLLSVELVALSTTLATNAIVEKEGQKVGMILMPPFGNAQNIKYEPKAVIQGEMGITGKVREAINPDQIRSIVEKMVETQHVTAFAVSGYAGSINPVQELEVKQIIQEQTGRFVSCGHELSDALNFKTRAITAMLNARIIPRLTTLLSDLEKVMATLHIKAPIVVVKGDGTLMSSDMAKLRPVETVLSGPAASVAGALHLTGLEDALVVDMGGTTTDTAGITDGQVSLNESGSYVGGHRTHVKALDIRTAGLGGDSLIAIDAGEFKIGPRRVAPIAWLGQTWSNANQAIKYLEWNINRYGSSTRKMQILVYTGAQKEIELNPLEQKILSLLKKLPLSIDELVSKAGLLTDVTLPLDRLEENFLIQRCGLTLTDLLHITGRFVKWDTDLAEKYCRMFSLLSGIETQEMIELLLQTGINKLSIELLKRQLEDQVNPDEIDTSPVCQVLMENLLSGGNNQYQVCIHLKRPVIGIGAPIKFFLPKAVKVLGAEGILPENADVANAIGAITSNVVIKKQLKIVHSERGGFRIEGLTGSSIYWDFEKADLIAREQLARMIRKQALDAGSSATRVELDTQDKIAKTALGEPIFIGRIIKGSLTGQPDVVLKQYNGKKQYQAQVCDC